MDDGNTQCLRRVFFGGGRKSQPLSSHCEAAVNVKVSRIVYANTTRDQYRFVNAEVEVEHETRDNAEWVSATQLAYISLTCHVIGHRLELFFFHPGPQPDCILCSIKECTVRGKTPTAAAPTGGQMKGNVTTPTLSLQQQQPAPSSTALCLLPRFNLVPSSCSLCNMRMLTRAVISVRRQGRQNPILETTRWVQTAGSCRKRFRSKRFG